MYELHRQIQTDSSDSIHREYPSTAFASSGHLLAADGHGNLYVLSLSENGPAKLINSYELQISEVYGSAQKSPPFRLHHAIRTSTGQCIAILSSKHYSDTPVTKEKVKTPIIKFDIWGVTIDLDSVAQDQTIPLDVVWHKRGTDVPLYVAYDDPRKAFMLLGSNPYRAINVQAPPSYEPSPDEIAPIPRAGENLDVEPTANADLATATPAKPPPYSWTQSSDEVTVAFPLPSSTPKSAIRVNFSPRTLTVLVDQIENDGNNSNSVLQTVALPRYTAKTLWDGIQPSTSFWTLDRQADQKFGLLTLHLDKQHEGTRWSQVFAASGAKTKASGTSSQPTSSSTEDVTDIEVPETLDPSELYQIRESLEKYTAALQNGEDPSGLGLGKGMPSLGEGEMDPEIDSNDTNTYCVTWVGTGVDGDGATTSAWEERLSDASPPFNLLSTPLPSSPSPQPSLVLKNGVDGVLFTLNETSSPSEPPEWKHTSTFSALSFVLASKRDTRFVHHISSQAVLAFESGFRGNVYIYRNTSKLHDKYAKQAVLKIGGGTSGGSLLGVGMIRTKNEGKPVIVCLCEGEWIVAHDVV